MIPKNLRNSPADIFTIYDGHYFIVSDYGNYSAIRNKTGTIKIEPYEGTMSEYLKDFDLERPRNRTLSYVSDFFGTTPIQFINNSIKEPK